jgi:hypothetical protein
MSDFHEIDEKYERVGLFNYDNLNEEHKKAAVEVVRIFKELNSAYISVLESLIKNRFQLEPVTEISPKSCLVSRAANKAGIHVAVQGFTKEVHDGKTYHYPIISLICDIRKMQEIYNIIQDEKVIVDKLINKK